MIVLIVAGIGALEFPGGVNVVERGALGAVVDARDVDLGGAPLARLLSWQYTADPVAAVATGVRRAALEEGLKAAQDADPCDSADPCCDCRNNALAAIERLLGIVRPPEIVREGGAAVVAPPPPPSPAEVALSRAQLEAAGLWL